MLAFVGSDYARKGLDLLIDALALLERAPAARPLALAVIGRDRREAAWQRRAARRGVAQRLRFLGFRRDVASLLAGSDGLVLPSYFDAFGNVVAEAMACGTPVIASARCGGSEWIREGENGFVLARQDAALLAQQLRALLAIGELAPLRAAARRQAEGYAWDATSRRARVLPRAGSGAAARAASAPVTTPPEFSEAAVLGEARRRTGLEHFGDPAFQEPLRRLLHSLEHEAALHEIGRLTWFERVVGVLVNRLRTEDWIARHPEILAERIEQPVVIVGLPRTGTTMLHRMIASDPSVLSLRWYESRNPAPFPDSEGAARDPRIEDAEREVAMMLETVPGPAGRAPDGRARARRGDPADRARVRVVESGGLLPRARLRRLAGDAGRHAGLPPPRSRAALSHLAEAPARRDRQALGAEGAVPPGVPGRPLQRVPRRARGADAPRPGRDGAVARELRAHAVPLNSDRVDPLEIGAHWGRKLAWATGRALRARAGREDRFLDVDYEALVSPTRSPARAASTPSRTCRSASRRWRACASGRSRTRATAGRCIATRWRSSA